VQPSRRTVASFLVGEWLPAVRMAGLRDSTWASYRMNVEKHLVPGLGAIELQRLSPAQLNAFYRVLLTEGRRNAAGGLAPKTVYYIHSILHRALRDAVRWGYVVRNVADAADPPKAKTPEMRVWSPAQLRVFLDYVRGDRLYAAWLLAATTGMRRGEILGLRWTDLDLEAGRVAVRRPRILVDYQVRVSEPKTAKGRRSLALDPVTVAALRVQPRSPGRGEAGGWWPLSRLRAGVHRPGRDRCASGAVLRLVPAASAGGRAAEDQAA
jgi:integrase